MGAYAYSAATNIFYIIALRANYDAANSWPPDAVDVDDSVFQEYSGIPPEPNQERVPGPDGMPAWGPSTMPLELRARNARDSFIYATDRMVIVDYSIADTLLTGEQRQALFDVRAAFRSWPTQPGWPETPFPSVPQWILDDLSIHNFTLPIWPDKK